MNKFVMIRINDSKELAKEHGMNETVLKMKIIERKFNESKILKNEEK